MDPAVPSIRKSLGHNLRILRYFSSRFGMFGSIGIDISQELGKHFSPMVSLYHQLVQYSLYHSPDVTMC